MLKTKPYVPENEAEKTEKKFCDICGAEATGTIRDIPVCNRHFSEYVRTAPLVLSGDIQKRNEPCKCGSGKKFKVCCGTKTIPARHYFNSKYMYTKLPKEQKDEANTNHFDAQA